MKQIKQFLVNRGAVQLMILISGTFLLSVAYGMILEPRIKLFLIENSAKEVLVDPDTYFVVMKLLILVALVIIVLLVSWIYGVILRILFRTSMPRFYLPQMYFVISQWPVLLSVPIMRFLFPGWLELIASSGAYQAIFSISSGILVTLSFSAILWLTNILSLKHALLYWVVISLSNIGLLLLSPSF